ncbi:sulfur carrier protein ThiS [Streptomyces sp. NPDC057638]|uniref:sulfur carrier protein ThiS n=1 Tax=Streptomyces sp. NPDC057638 TaxID=3346190 RepID=UPI00367E5D61
MTSVSVVISVNGARHELARGTTLDHLIADVTRGPGTAPEGDPAEPPTGIAAAVNETVVPRGEWPGTLLGDGDRVEVLTAVQGG